ncbi:MAG: hypothetical protein MI924_32625 [Chloroflexales bacterium]|nr:hypothetical protein [Chloroflexales bacterium]
MILANRNADKLRSAVATLGERASFVVTDATVAEQVQHLYRSLAPIDRPQRTLIRR